MARASSCFSLTTRVWPRATAVCGISRQVDHTYTLCSQGELHLVEFFCRALDCSFRLSSSCSGTGYISIFRTCPKLETKEDGKLWAGREVRGCTKNYRMPEAAQFPKKFLQTCKQTRFRYHQVARLCATDNEATSNCHRSLGSRKTCNAPGIAKEDEDEEQEGLSMLGGYCRTTFRSIATFRSRGERQHDYGPESVQFRPEFPV